VSGHFLQFFFASLVIIIVPGPSVTFTIARAVAWGRRVAVLTVLGNSLGTLLLSMVIAFGLGPLLQRSHWFSVALQLLGGGYLIYLGYEAWRHREAAALKMTQPEMTEPHAWQIVRQGFTVGILNPKSLVFFGAVFPHFVDRTQGNVTEQLVVFGCVFALIAFCSDGTWGLIAGTAREWLANAPHRLIRMRVVAAAVMVTLGGLILLSALGA
jgi:threonine/homoserine/homoserine lactone efflux protein